MSPTEHPSLTQHTLLRLGTLGTIDLMFPARATTTARHSTEVPSAAAPDCRSKCAASGPREVGRRLLRPRIRFHLSDASATQRPSASTSSAPRRSGRGDTRHRPRLPRFSIASADSAAKTAQTQPGRRKKRIAPSRPYLMQLTVDREAVYTNREAARPSDAARASRSDRRNLGHKPDARLRPSRSWRACASTPTPTAWHADLPRRSETSHADRPDEMKEHRDGRVLAASPRDRLPPWHRRPSRSGSASSAVRPLLPHLIASDSRRGTARLHRPAEEVRRHEQRIRRSFQTSTLTDLQLYQARRAGQLTDASLRRQQPAGAGWTRPFRGPQASPLASLAYSPAQLVADLARQQGPQVSFSHGFSTLFQQPRHWHRLYDLIVYMGHRRVRHEPAHYTSSRRFTTSASNLIRLSANHVFSSGGLRAKGSASPRVKTMSKPRQPRRFASSEHSTRRTVDGGAAGPVSASQEGASLHRFLAGTDSR